MPRTQGAAVMKDWLKGHRVQYGCVHPALPGYGSTGYVHRIVSGSPGNWEYHYEASMYDLKDSYRRASVKVSLEWIEANKR